MRPLTYFQETLLLAYEKQLDPGDRFLAGFLFFWGAGAAVSGIATMLTKGSEEAVIGFIIFVIGAVITFKSARTLIRRHRIRLYPATGTLIETVGLWKEKLDRHFRLEHYDSVVTGMQTSTNKKNGNSYKCITVRLLGIDGNTDLKLGEFYSPGRALDQAVGVSLATNLDLEDRISEPNYPRTIHARQLGHLPDRGRLDVGQTFLPDSSHLPLVFVNCVPMIGVLFLDWEILPLMLLFWSENIVVGIMAVLRVLAATVETNTKILLVPFFILHFGGFTMIHGALITALFDTSKVSYGGTSIVDRLGFSFWLAVFLLFMGHLYIYMSQYIGEKQYQRTNPIMLMIEPYQRVVLMQAGVFVLALAVQVLHMPVMAMAAVVVAKIALDIRAQQSQYRRFDLSHYDRIR